MKGLVLVGLVGGLVGFLPGVYASNLSSFDQSSLTITQSAAPIVLAAASKAKSRKTINRGGRVFVFSPRHKRWYAYRNGHLVRSGKASGGAHRCSGKRGTCYTPRGTFRISRKGGSGCRSGRYPRPNGGAWMGYCMFFSKYYAVHASNNVPNYNASHGCIRVKPAAARWLSKSFLRIGDTVRVTSY